MYYKLQLGDFPTCANSKTSWFPVAPEDLEASMSTAFPFLLSAGWWHPSGHRACAAPGAAAGQPLPRRSLCRHLWRPPGSHLPAREGEQRGVWNIALGVLPTELSSWNNIPFQITRVNQATTTSVFHLCLSVKTVIGNWEGWRRCASSLKQHPRWDSEKCLLKCRTQTWVHWRAKLNSILFCFVFLSQVSQKYWESKRGQFSSARRAGEQIKDDSMVEFPVF